MTPARLRTTLATLVLGSCLGAAMSQADEEPPGDDRIDSLVQMLVERGVLSADEAETIVEKNRAYEQQRNWYDRIEFSGDFRGRYEGFFYNRDPLGNERADRSRLRYRARLTTHVDLGKYADFQLRLASGTSNKSHNSTLGNSADFGSDAIVLDQAFIRLRPLGTSPSIFATRRLELVFGKMPNPFRSKQGQDLILWDSDLTAEGIALNWSTAPCDCLDLGLDAAYYVLREVSSGRDPGLFALQLDAVSTLSESLEAGASLSWYGYRKLDAAFFARGSFGNVLYEGETNNTLSGGNVPGGMTSDSAIDVGDLRAWLRFARFEDWPVMLYGNVAMNFSAVDTVGFGAGKEDLAWSLGLEIGDKRRFLRLGAAWFWVEANAVPANFTDSDLFDGRTNGKGWFLYATRELWSNVDLHAELFISDAINSNITGPTGLPSGDPNVIFVDAIANHDRLRFRGDVIVHF